MRPYQRFLWVDQEGDQQARLVDEKELLDKNEIFLKPGVKERFYQEINQDPKEEAVVFEDDFGGEDFCKKQKRRQNRSYEYKTQKSRIFL